MPWVKFTADYDYKPQSQVTIGFRAGMVCSVTRACQQRAVAAGKAVKMVKRSKDAEPVEVSDDPGRPAD